MVQQPDPSRAADGSASASVAIPDVIVTWARNELRLPERGTLASQRVALLKRIEADSFLPEPAFDAALAVVRTLERGAPPMAEALQVVAPFLSAIETEPRRPVEHFVAQFFQIPVAPRRGRWQTLVEQYGCFPALMARLRRLEPALDVDEQVTTRELPPVQALVSHLLELMASTPAERARRRYFPQGWELRIPAYCQAAIVALRKQWPALVAFDPELIRKLEARPELFDVLGLAPEEIESQPERLLCPWCARPIEEDMDHCPSCRKVLKRIPDDDEDHMRRWSVICCMHKVDQALKPVMLTGFIVMGILVVFSVVAVLVELIIRGHF